jgi:opacity protein-like surface antigen
MKKQFLLFCAAALMTSGLMAQDLTFGAMAGVNMSTISESVDPEPDEFESSDALGFGFQVGAFGEYAISESIGLRAELQVQQRGLSDDVPSINENGEEVTIDTKQSDLFVQIPVLLAINAGESLSFHVGPTLGFLASSKNSIDGEDLDSEFQDEINEDRNGFELGLALGAQYNLNETMGLGVRYTRGLTDLQDENEFEGVTFKTNYNVFQLYFSYAFGG